MACRSVVNGIMAQVASNLKTTVDVTDLAYRTLDQRSTNHVYQILRRI